MRTVDNIYLKLLECKAVLYIDMLLIVHGHKMTAELDNIAFLSYIIPTRTALTTRLFIL